MTDKTPIQFSEDDRQLLRQMAGLVQDIHLRLSVLENKFTGFENRLSVLENKFTALENKFTALEDKFSAF